MITYKIGNILDAPENIIVQSVNHKGVMGGGLALQIKNRYPGIMDPFGSYLHMCKRNFNDIRINGYVSRYDVSDSKFIVSIFGQDGLGRYKQYTDYVSLKNGLESIGRIATLTGGSIAIPHGIGCGLGGGDWNVVKAIIERCFSHYPQLNVSIYKLKD